MKSFLNIATALIVALSFSANASETVDGAKKDYENFKTEMSVKLEKVENELSLLKEKVKVKSTSAQAASISELEKTQAKLKYELSEMKQTGAVGWKKFKANFAASVDKLNSKVQKSMQD